MFLAKNNASLSFFDQEIIKRILIFIVIFVAFSGIIGSWIISTNKLLFPFHFWIYGSAGKSILFGLVTFLLLTKQQLLKLPLEKLNKSNLVFLAATTISSVFFVIVAHQLLKYSDTSEALFLTFVAHALIITSGSLAFLSAFGWRYPLQVIKAFTKEFIFSSALAVAFYFLFSHIFKLWPYLSAIVLWAVSHMLKITNPEATVIPPLSIQLKQFTVTIGEYCSGIESVILITTLYALIGCLEWKKLRKNRFILAFFPLIIGMFSLNIVRVFVIIQAGVWLSPAIAARLFHTYLGMILFMVYFFLFWKYSAPVLLKSNRNHIAKGE